MLRKGLGGQRKTERKFQREVPRKIRGNPRETPRETEELAFFWEVTQSFGFEGESKRKRRGKLAFLLVAWASVRGGSPFGWFRKGEQHESYSFWGIPCLKKRPQVSDVSHPGTDRCGCESSLRTLFV